MTLHPLHALGFEPIPSRPPRSLADLGFEIATRRPGVAHPQPVGAADPASGRTIVQPTNTAMDRFHSKNGGALEKYSVAKSSAEKDMLAKGALAKGSRVRLADGALARVLYVDPQHRFARVRTVDGKNTTVRHKDLRGPLQA